MKDLNGHYCLATKEHYEKLIKDGYKPDEKLDINNYKYISVGNCTEYENEFCLTNVEFLETPMHLHNNEWVIGSLEHEERFDYLVTPFEARPLELEIKLCEEYYDKSYSTKPVERITREEILQHTNGRLSQEMSKTEIINKCFDYIEYLEANQK